MATHSSQYSCLENPRDRGAWWAAVYGVTQSWTQLKRLSSSSSMIYPNILESYILAHINFEDFFSVQYKVCIVLKLYIQGEGESCFRFQDLVKLIFVEPFLTSLSTDRSFIQDPDEVLLKNDTLILQNIKPKRLH